MLKGIPRITIGVALIAIILILGFGSGQPYGVFNPGFEGAKATFYGADIRLTSWTGAFQLHRYQDAENPLATYYDGFRYFQTIYWANTATPNDANIGWKIDDYVGHGDRELPTLEIQVESNLQLQDINRQGDPTGWNITEPMDARHIEYWTKTAVKTSETDTAITYSYNVTKESFFLAPAEFWIGYILVPSQTNAGMDSGWREGEWQNIQTWFRLDFNVWDNAYYDEWINDPKLNIFASEFGGVVANQQRLYEYRGGFPIAGWIQGWEKAGFASDFPGEERFSDIWIETKGMQSKTYSIDLLGDKKNVLMSRVQFSPGLIGSTISLFDEPASQFSYTTPSDAGSHTDATKRVKSPDSRLKKVMYFPMTIQNFGTLALGDWWNGWTVYYPTTYFRIRMLYGVYGKFTYLWTEETAKALEYPGFERRGTTIIHAPGLWENLGGWTFNWILIAIIFIALGIIFLVFIGPFLGFGLSFLIRLRLTTGIYLQSERRDWLR